MKKVIQMTIEEFVQHSKRENWNLKVGDVYVDTNEKQKWCAYEVTGFRPIYGSEEPILEEYALQII